ncbi:MAG: hypothetical protein K2G26_06090, partial [Clostridia bacterium]|nr:hypothetical protein [Clostridia bacterium]
MKAFSKCFAVVLTAASLITLGGCAKSTPDNRVATTANWNARTSAIVEKNYLDYWQSHKEVAEYGITFKDTGANGYSVSYDTENAVYTTEFYMEKSYDWQSAAIPEEYRLQEASSEPVYVYTTSLAISGAYKITATGEEKKFDDVLQSVSKFRLAGNNLQPVYSKQIIKNTAPNSLGTQVMEVAYVQTDSVFETFYNKDCTEALVKQTDNLAEVKEKDAKKIKLNDKSGLSVFDNSQLRAAVRAFTMTGGASRKFKVVAPQNGAVQVCTATITSPVELDRNDESQKAIINALDNCAPDDYIFFDGTPSSGDETARTYRYNAVALSINADLKGSDPTCWYSTVENNDVNGTRSVLLRMTTPVSFGLGTLTYSLKALNVKD